MSVGAAADGSKIFRRSLPARKQIEQIVLKKVRNAFHTNVRGRIFRPRDWIARSG